MPRWRLPPMSTKGLILAVAAAGMLLGAGVIGSRWYRTRQFALVQAAECERLQQRYLAMAANFREAFILSRDEMARIAAAKHVETIVDSLKDQWARDLREEVAGCRTAAAEQAAMRQRFLRVATFPWLAMPAYDPFAREVMSPRERRAVDYVLRETVSGPP